MRNKISRNSYLVIYLILAFLSLATYAILNIQVIQNPNNSSLSFLWLINIIFIILSFFIYLFIILYFKYPLKMLFLFLIPVLGGIIFVSIALFSQSKAEDFKLEGKLWNLSILFALLILSQTTGFLIQYFILSAPPSLFIILLDLLLFIGTFLYFIYWGRTKMGAWHWKNFWSSKWDVLIFFLALFIWTILWPSLLSIFGQTVAEGENQELVLEIMSMLPFYSIFLHGTLGAAMFEETIFRLGIHRFLFPKRPKLAFFCSVFFFSLVHMMNASFLDWKVWGTYIGMSIILSTVYYKNQKIEASFSLHFLWNSFAFLISLLA
ncbi:MAG: lysostaphin resistance A-like protein [Lactovum sp.]